MNFTKKKVFIGLSIALVTVFTLNFVSQLKYKKAQHIDRAGLDISSKSYGGRYNIIEEYYEQALNDNSALEDLDDKIKDLKNSKSKDLSDYRDYTSEHSKFYSAYKSMINQIDDEELKTELTSRIQKLENKYQSEISPYETLEEKIDSRSKELSDHHTALKLIVAEQQLSKFEKENPISLTPLQKTENNYESIIEEIIKTYKNLSLIHI